MHTKGERKIMRRLYIILVGSLLIQGCGQKFGGDQTHVVMEDGTKRERACSFVRKTINDANDDDFAYMNPNNYTTEEYRRIQEIDRVCIKQMRLQEKDYNDYTFLKKKMESFKKRARKVLDDAFKTK